MATPAVCRAPTMPDIRAKTFLLIMFLVLNYTRFPCGVICFLFKVVVAHIIILFCDCFPNILEKEIKPYKYKYQKRYRPK